MGLGSKRRNEPAKGHSWESVKGGELHGVIFFHCGDESEFSARKTYNRKKTKSDD
jgi:hypothetical protein